MFKNLQTYRLPRNYAMTAATLIEAIKHQVFVPCTSTEAMRQGWVPPREGGELVYAVGKNLLLTLCTETKVLPAAVINQAVKVKVAELEEAQGFAPGKKATKELKERVTDDLLAKAFARKANTAVWIDPVNGWLVVDAPMPGKAGDVIRLLLKALDGMPLESLRVQRSPVAVMTGWLECDEAPTGFTVDQDVTLRATGESKATVTYKRHALEADDMGRHIAAGKQCVRLAMTWNGKISFVLTETLAVKSIKLLDIIKENDVSTRNHDERFDNDMTLMTGELAKLLAALVAELGGEAQEGDIPEGTNDEQGDDDLYPKAVTILQTNDHASISLVQRHLRIGYNRAARLLELMEAKGVVSAMASNGSRNVTPATAL